MTKFDTYKNAFPHAGLTRSTEGILEVVFPPIATPSFLMGTPTRSPRTCSTGSARMRIAAS